MTHNTTRTLVPLSAILALAALVVATSANSVSAVTISWVPVGNSLNPADPATTHGAVADNYYIGQYDVTIGQYTEFLNKVAKADAFGLYNPLLNSNLTGNLNVGGIARTGSSPNFSYSVIGASANLPVTYVSWGDAARFSNWMHNGQPTGAQGPLTTEQGAYTLNGATTNAALMGVTRNPSATVFIPSEDQFYKAAYYNGAGSYNNYPFSSNTVPTSALPGATPNTGNFQQSAGSPFALTPGDSVLHFDELYLSDVGAYSGSASPYGAFDMGGNVWQWNEAIVSGTSRGYRGSSWSTTPNLMQKAVQNFGLPTSENAGIGFRLAMVPEPSTVAMASIGLVGLVGLMVKRRRARRA